MRIEEPLEGHAPVPRPLAEAYRRKGYWKPPALGERLDAWAARSGSRIALVCGEERVSYAELALRADRLAAALAGIGVRRRERVLLQLPNRPELVVLAFALFKLGAIPVMALPAHRETEIRHFLQFTQAVAYCAPAELRGFDYLEMARAVAPQAPALRHVLDASTLASLSRGTGAARLPPGSGPAPADVALLMPSGGSTGLPKLIPRTHEDYGYNIELSVALSGMDARTVFLAALPVAHNFSFATPGVLGTLLAGGTAVLAPSPSVECALPLVERERVTHTSVVPAVAIQWLDAAQCGRHDLSSLRVLQVGGTRLAADTARRAERLLGATVQQVYGMAEGLNNVTRLDDPEDVRCETQGRPLSPDDELRIVGPDGEPVPPGGRGELLARGPYTVRGYYKAPEQNAVSFTADGFYRTGDLVRMTPGGNLCVEGRIKDLINRGCEKISAEEIESLILAHPAVQNAAVVAMPDPLMGERVCAFVVPRPAAALTLQGLREFLADARIAPFKLPEWLEQLERLPLTGVGKVSKQALRELIAAKLAAQPATTSPGAQRW